MSRKEGVDVDKLHGICRSNKVIVDPFDRD